MAVLDVDGVFVPDVTLGAGATAQQIENNTDQINAALLAYNVVLLPAGTIRCDGTITIPYGKELRGVGFNAMLVDGGGEQYATALSFNANVSPCVELGGLQPTGPNTVGYANIPTALTSVHVTRAAGTITLARVGVSIDGGYNVRLENVMSSRHGIGFSFKNRTDTNRVGEGISAKVNGIYTAAIKDTHLLIDTWPELYISGGRLGQNGSIDLAAESYIRITGGAGPINENGQQKGAQGPNTLSVDQVQFNQGSNPPNCWLHFEDLKNTGTNALEFKFSNCHVEGVSNSFIKSTIASTITDPTGINYLTVDSCTFNQPAVDFFDLDPKTIFNSLNIDSCDIFTNCFKIAPAAGIQLNDVVVSNSRISGSTIVRLPELATASFSDMSFGSDVTVGGIYTNPLNADGDQTNDDYTHHGVINFCNPTFTAGGFVFDGDRNIKVFIANYGGEFDHTTDNIGLAIGGVTSGIVYTVKTASWQYSGNRVDIDFRIGITGKGNLTGPVTITNLPVPFDTKHGGQGAGGGIVTLMDNVTGVTSPMVISPQTVNGSATAMGLWMGASTGLTQVTGANLNPSITSPTRLYGHFSYTF